MLPAALLLLTACATEPTDKVVYRPAGCVTYFEYPQSTLDQAADEYEALDQGGLRTLADDYGIVRAETRAAGCI